MDVIQERLDGQRKWLHENCPECFTEQKHLDEGSSERAYWHHGYQAALADVLNWLKPPAVIN